VTDSNGLPNVMNAFGLSRHVCDRIIGLFRKIGSSIVQLIVM